MNQLVKIDTVSLGGRLLFAACLLVVAHADVEAEIGPVSIDNAMQELYEAKRTLSPERTEISLPIEEFVSMVPDMARVVLPDDAARRPANIRAIFAVRQPGGGIGDTKSVRMERIDEQTYAVARRAMRTFRSWLLKRTDNLFEGSVVLDRIVGLEPDGISFRLSIDEVSEELFSLADAEWESDRSERVLEGISGVSIMEGVFGDLEGGTRRFAEFEGQPLLLHIWATWCPPCIAEMPALEALQHHYAGSGLAIVNLSDESADVIRDWLSENPSTMVHGRVDAFEFLLGDPPPEGADRILRSRPVYVVVDREAVVREVRQGFVERHVPGATNADSPDEPEHFAADLVKPYL